jgi:hypothetical protein
MPKIANDDVQLANHLGLALAWKFPWGVSLGSFFNPRLSG